MGQNRPPSLLGRTAALVAAFTLSAGAAAGQLPTTVSGSAAPRSRTDGAVGAATTAPATTAASAARIRQLRCRGASGAFDFESLGASPRAAGYEALHVRYGISRLPVDGDWTAIAPGTCSWNDLEGPPEPGEVTFDVAGITLVRADGSASNDAAFIRTHLNDSRNWWTFYVPEAGPQIAISHGPLQVPLAAQAMGPAPGSPVLPTEREGSIDVTRRADGGVPIARETPTQRGMTRADEPAGRATENEVVARWVIGEPAVTPGVEQVAITFTGGPTSPRVTVSLVPPVRDDVTGRYLFADPTPLRVTRSRSGSRWSYSATERSPLQQGTLYHYLVDVPPGAAGNEAGQQATGSFTTLTRYARVVFDEIHVRDDGDDGAAIDGDDEGEIKLDFFLKVGEADAVGRSVPERGYSSGKRYPLRVVVDLERVPTQLRLVVYGHEADGIGTFSRLFTPTDPALLEADLRHENGNAARLNIDVSRFAGRTVPFTLASPANDGNVAFTITGSIDVSIR